LKSTPIDPELIVKRYRLALLKGQPLPDLKNQNRRKSHHNWFFGIIFLFGIFLLGQSLLPLVKASWQIFWEQQTQAIYPLPMDVFLAKANTGPKILGEFTNFNHHQPVVLESLIDYGNLENWFGNHQLTSKPTETTYLLHIDKLNIKNALVKVGGTNIDHNLVQFNTDVELGDYGAPVIFGHSILRQFYNPKETNKDRYKSIFSTIMTLKIGDEIKIETGNLTYTYTVTEKKEVPPEDDYILAQNTNVRQIKLVTCTPEGTYLRRGVITAELKI